MIVDLHIDLDHKDIELALANRIMLKAAASRALILKNVRIAFGRYIRGTPEWASLQNADDPDSLRSQFGLSSSSMKLDGILDAWADSFKIGIYNKSTINKLDIEIILTGVRSDFSDVLSLDLASYYSKGAKINWLRWLLLEADTIELPGFTILTKGSFKSSRTGLSIMAKSKKDSWKLPPQWRIAKEDNFVNRISRNPEFIAQIIEAVKNGLL